MNDSAGAQLGRLLSFLDSDPDNPALLSDAVQAALDAGDIERAGDLAARLQAVTPGATSALYLAAMVAMRRLDFAAARNLLKQVAEQEDGPNVRFSLAWCEAMIGDKVEALVRLDERTTDAIPAAAMLRTQLLHEAGDFTGALEFGKAALTRFPDDRGLLSAVATLAIDLEDAELARECAHRGGDHPEALAASGILDLQDGDIETARMRFDKSLAIRDHNPRAWIGRGLSSLVRSDAASAASDLDRGAQQFGEHIGTWIAAGWAHYLAGDVAAATDRFERAMAIDPNFAECHGSLAVVDLARGDTASARQRMTTALRLDRNCFSAALVQLLMNQADPERSRQIVEQAFNTPIGESGLTIASYMAGLSRPTVH